MGDFNLEDLALPSGQKPKREETRPPPRHGKGEKFLKGPVPWNWLAEASRSSGQGKGLHVANAIWFLVGMADKRTIKLSHSVLREMGVNRNAAYRGLEKLEKTALISVDRRNGQSPIVTVLDLKE